MKIRCTENKVEWDCGGFTTSVKPKEAIRLNECVLVIHDYMAYPLEMPAPNLVAYSLAGERLWVAENPGFGATDAYVNFISELPLVVGNFAGYDCTIDSETGKLINAKFTK